jgi:hypothetical protein
MTSVVSISAGNVILVGTLDSQDHATLNYALITAALLRPFLVEAFPTPFCVTCSCRLKSSSSSSLRRVEKSIYTGITASYAFLGMAKCQISQYYDCCSSALQSRVSLCWFILQRRYLPINKGLEIQYSEYVSVLPAVGSLACSPVGIPDGESKQKPIPYRPASTLISELKFKLVSRKSLA